MSSPRLRVQFETLFEHFNGQDAGIQLDDVTEVLFCTRRNARIVLNKLAEEGWIEWHPAAGRGKLSQLIFKRNRNDVSENLAKRYLDDGKIGQALDVLGNDTAKLGQVIQNYLGIQHQAGEQVIRLPYYRPLSILNPLKSMRRSEQHITRQIFSGLTRLDEHEQIQADLAHSWQALSDTHWRFYLRPGVRFHNGQPLLTRHVVQSLLSIRSFNLFSHINKVTSPSEWVIDIDLAKPDRYLPLALTESRAKILLPRSRRNDDYDLLPVGTGPYRVERNDDKKLVLRAYDGYFGFRPLIDTVEVWVIDKAYSSMVFPSISNPITSERSSSDEVKLDPGCMYLLLNRRNGIAKNPHWASYLSQRLSGFELFKHLPEDKIVELGLLQAYGIKPGWYDKPPALLPMQPPEPGVTLAIAYQTLHPMFPVITDVISNILSEQGISTRLVGYDLTPPSSEEIDIWIKPMGIANYRDDALAGWLLDYSDIESCSSSDDFSKWMLLVDQWRSGNDQSFPARELGKQLVVNYQIIPMFHCWLGVNKDHCGSLQNAKCNALGWFDFSQVWVKPEFNDSVR
ncbi:transcriptional regulator [Vibrio sp. 10N.286.49.B3]|uniref:SgrR family transcriptional regulator n=1 Tax=Vibrio sp. 10N.286.49.B3 TaxID=1880855 RepID=UPI000C82EA88|nr:SgrR family transcriptional regulator [Vibrio sp. 10N.286.49.B3]PMH41417.1 transcriptional regulator [Vibrio sp. 10N.286.49.B3]